MQYPLTKKDLDTILGWAANIKQQRMLTEDEAATVERVETWLKQRVATERYTRQHSYATRRPRAVRG
jgi:hypothetical protein